MGVTSPLAGLTDCRGDRTTLKHTSDSHRERFLDPHPVPFRMFISTRDNGNGNLKKTAIRTGVDSILAQKPFHFSLSLSVEM